MAIILYCPVAVGVHIFAKLPFESQVVSPIGMVFPVGSMAVKVTVTPEMLAGLGFCRNRYCIQASMSTSDMAGVSFIDGVWSVTVPVTIIPVPRGT